jgi:Ca2+-binding RTX toxin-like protein
VLEPDPGGFVKHTIYVWRNEGGGLRQCVQPQMGKIMPRSKSVSAATKQQFIDTAAQISDAVDGGASPADPAVISLLNSINEQFKPSFKVGTDSRDFLFSKGAGLNYVNALGGNDFVIGSYKTDVLVGGQGDDFLVGLGGRDGLFGGAGNDALFGGMGDDLLRGGSGNDHLKGNSGNDSITGGTGDDVLVGGRGADKFFFNPAREGEGHDRITDFLLGTDTIVLKVADVLASTPGLLGLAGDPNAFDPEDLDVSELWNLSASHDGDLVVSHPMGAIELDGIKFDASLNFRAILPAIELI